MDPCDWHMSPTVYVDKIHSTTGLQPIKEYVSNALAGEDGALEDIKEESVVGSKVLWLELKKPLSPQQSTIILFYQLLPNTSFIMQAM